MDPELDQLVRPPSLAVFRHSRPEGKQGFFFFFFFLFFFSFFFLSFFFPDLFCFSISFFHYVLWPCFP